MNLQITAAIDAIDAIDRQLLIALQTDASRTNQDLAGHCGLSPATCLRRVARLRARGFIASQVAVLDADRLASVLGHGLTALIDVTLDRQDAESLDAFETRAVADDAVQQCYRVSPGPDFVLVAHTADMPAHLALTQRLLTSDANVRNTKTHFSVKRAKFKPKVLISPAPAT